ncbi:MAG: aminotransferase class I/II-fold pyridoxal phosphate-dependent enzyme [Rhodospirillaceae bacterium]|nr:aminotransferase class I/II-fold pyridoxal phosphate-dependent enzyme [Rhodospirillaceae bacterium]
MAIEQTRAAGAWMKPWIEQLPVDGVAVPQGGAKAAVAPRALNLNESPYPPSPKAVEAIRAAAGTLNRYADYTASALAHAVSARTGIAASRIVFGCGSEEMILAACTAAAGPGDEVVMPSPSFPSFASSTVIQGAKPVPAPIDAAGASDPKTLAAAITARTRLVFCCTPNAPSGGMMSAAALAEIAAAVPDDVLLIVDEAYHEYGRHAGGAEVLPIMARRKGPWAALRTFSKAYGLAGARIGYALCGSDEVADAFRRVKLYYGASVPAQAAALAALEDEAYLAQTLDAVAHERRRLSDGMRKMGLAPMPSGSNFVSVRLPIPSSRSVAEFRARGILVRPWGHPDFPNELRITIGRDDDTDAVLAALGEILAAVPA